MAEHRKNYHLVEGDWKNFTFRRITDDDVPKVMEHLKANFLRDEPTSKLLGYTDGFAEDITRLVHILLEDKLSFLVEEKTTKDIAAVRITFHHKGEESEDISGIFQSREGKLIFKLLSELEVNADLPNRLGIHSFAEFFLVSTDRNYRQLGLARELYERSIKFLKAEGFKHVMVVTSSPHTRKSTEKLGFDVIAKTDYSEFKDFDGNPVFTKEQLTPEHFASLKVLDLTK